MKKYLYEILVPTIMDGQPVNVKYHRLWDAKVRKFSNGLTIHSTSKGQWISPDGELFIERMIPVRIMCSDNDIEEISKMTAEHYNQQAVMFYKISSEVEIRHY